jgi:hypothetical protein
MLPKMLSQSDLRLQELRSALTASSMRLKAPGSDFIDERKRDCSKVGMQTSNLPPADAQEKSSSTHLKHEKCYTPQDNATAQQHVHIVLE